MSKTALTDLVVVAAGVLAFAAYAGLILVPAWTAYTRLWERLAAAFLSLYALAAFAGVGIVGALVVVYYWG